MNTNHALIALLGGAAVYVAVAASSTEPTRHFAAKVVERIAHPVEPAHAEVSGTRLKAKYTAGSDGSKLYDPEVLSDSELGVDCAFGLASDSTTRCLPTISPASIATFVEYTDSKCEDPIALINPPPSGCTPAPPKYVFTNDAQPYCPTASGQTPTHVYTVGAFVSTATMPLFRIQNGTCQSGQQSSNFLVYTLSQELPATTFAAGTPGTDP